jgi:hypothetical protein
MNLQHSVTNGAAKRVSSVDVTSDSAQNPSMSVIGILRQLTNNWNGNKIVCPFQVRCVRQKTQSA